MLIAFFLAAQLGAETPLNPATATSFDQAPAKTKNAKKEKKDQGGATAGKPKKKKKVAKETEASPDEPVDPAADAPARGFRFSWKQHPSLRYGDSFRLDVEGKMQEDGHSAYGPVKDLAT